MEQATEKTTASEEKVRSEPGDFVNFLRYCSERLSKGEQVQAIWRDYLAKVQGRS